MPAQPVSETPPHPLDDAFATGDEGQMMHALNHHHKVRVALKKAAEAYHDAASRPPGLMAPSPPHAARQAFLDELNSSN